MRGGGPNPAFIGLTTVTVRTRHPEHYVLVNVVDGTRWVIEDEHWVAEPFDLH